MLKADLLSRTGFFLYPTPWISGNVQNRIAKHNIFLVSVFLFLKDRKTLENPMTSAAKAAVFPFFFSHVLFYAY